jgi:hypothetical protein
VVISTECEHCRQPMHIEIDSDLRCRVREDGAEPLAFVPLVEDFAKLADPCITDAF